MYLYSTAKILFLFVVQLKVQTRATHTNDVTKAFDTWFANAFELNASKAESIVNEMIVKNRNLGLLKQRMEDTVHRGPGHIFFPNPQSQEGKSTPAQIDFSTSANKIRLFYKKLTLRIPGKMNIPHGCDFVARHSIENTCFTFTALAPSTLDNEPNHMKISQNFSYSGTLTKLEVPNQYGKTSCLQHLNELIEQVEQKELPYLLRQHFYDSLKVFRSLNEFFQSAIQQKNELFSKYPNLPNSPEKFYYSIAEIPFFCFALKRIRINGLSNLNTFTIGEPFPIFTHTLLVKNIEGKMTLDYESEKESPLKMNFKIDHLFLMKDEKNDCGSVQAQYWQISRAKTNTLLEPRHSQVMIEALQSAIASSLLPSMKVGKICTETPPQNIKITNASDWESKKKSYKEWVPFNED